MLFKVNSCLAPSKLGNWLNNIVFILRYFRISGCYMRCYLDKNQNLHYKVIYVTKISNQETFKESFSITA